MKRAFVIYNPSAGGAADRASTLDEWAKQYDFQWFPTNKTQTAKSLAIHAARQNVDRIVIFGGDGTIHEVVNGLAPDFQTEVAFVPCGTGNDLARSIGLPLDAIEKTTTIAFEYPAVEVDLIRIKNHDCETFCVNAVNGGLGGCVAIDVNSDAKRIWGNLAYWSTAISKFGDLPTFDTTIDLDDDSFELVSTGIAVANGRFVGGGFPIAPNAFLNDGLLNVSVAPLLPTIEMMAAGLNFVLGRHEREDRVQTFEARKVHIRSNPPMPFSIDGEPVSSFDATFEVMPNALKLVAGEDPAALK